MDIKDLVKVRSSETIEHMLNKIDEEIDEAKDNGYMSHEAVETIMVAWKAIHLAKNACTAFNA